MCDVGRGGMVSSPCYHLVEKWRIWRKKVWLTAKKIAGASISGGERKMTAFHHLQDLLTFVLRLRYIYKIGPLQKFQKFLDCFGCVQRINDGLSVDFFFSFSLLFTVTTCDQFKVFLVPGTTKRLNSSSPSTGSNLWDCCRRVSDLSRSNISQALLRRCVSNGAFLEWCPRHSQHWGVIKRGGGGEGKLPWNISSRWAQLNSNHLCREFDFSVDPPEDFYFPSSFQSNKLAECGEQSRFIIDAAKNGLPL